jgi:hypothetical protein
MCTLYGKSILFMVLKLVVHILTTSPSEVNTTASCGPQFSKFRGTVEDSDHNCVRSVPRSHILVCVLCGYRNIQ